MGTVFVPLGDGNLSFLVNMIKLGIFLLPEEIRDLSKN